jgi:hypothetical protein
MMRIFPTASTLIGLIVAVAPAANAQGAAGADSINPAVNTSAQTPEAAPAAAAQKPASPVDLAAAAGTSRRAPEATAAASTPASAATAPGAVRAPGSSDRVELGTTEISGNRELPKLMYIVPWQRAEVGKVTGRPPNSLVDEALTPIDRTVFGRQNDYFAALQAASAPRNSSPASRAAPTEAPPAAAGPRDEK